MSASPRERIWSHRGVALYRYRSSSRSHPLPLLLVFALINRRYIFDLRPGGSLVEYLLGEGFDVFVLDWGEPDEEDADTGFEEHVCDELHWAIREKLRARGAEELTLLGWCMGATMCAMYCGLEGHAEQTAVRNRVLLTCRSTAATPSTRRWRARRSSTPSRSPIIGGRCPAGRSTLPTSCSSR